MIISLGLNSATHRDSRQIPTAIRYPLVIHTLTWNPVIVAYMLVSAILLAPHKYLAWLVDQAQGDSS